MKCILNYPIRRNARLHASLQTQQKLIQLYWEVLLHLSYATKLVPFVYHLYWSLQNNCNGKNFNFLKVCKNTLTCLSTRKMQISKKIEYWSYLEDGKRYLNKMAHMWVNKSMYKYLNIVLEIHCCSDPILPS